MHDPALLTLEAAEARIASRRETFERVSAKELFRGPPARWMPPAHGDFPEGLETFDAEADPSTCTDCGGRGWNAAGERSVAECHCRRPRYPGAADVPAEALTARGCPVKLAELQRSTWDETRAPWPHHGDHWPREYLNPETGKPDSRHLYIFSRASVGAQRDGTGNGKSRVAAWIMRRWLAAGMACRWVDVPLVVAMAKNAIGSDEAARDFETWKAAFSRCRGVVLDDVGNHRHTDFAVLDLFAPWVRQLEEANAWIVSTSNLHPAQLRAMHAPTASRLLAGPKCELTGGDARDREWVFSLADAIREGREKERGSR